VRCMICMFALAQSWISLEVYCCSPPASKKLLPFFTSLNKNFFVLFTLCTSVSVAVMIIMCTQTLLHDGWVNVVSHCVINSIAQQARMLMMMMWISNFPVLTSLFCLLKGNCWCEMRMICPFGDSSDSKCFSETFLTKKNTFYEAIFNKSQKIQEISWNFLNMKLMLHDVSTFLSVSVLTQISWHCEKKSWKSSFFHQLLHFCFSLFRSSHILFAQNNILFFAFQKVHHNTYTNPLLYQISMGVLSLMKMEFGGNYWKYR